MPSSGVEETSIVVDANAASSTRVFDIEINCKLPIWSVAEYKTRYSDSLDSLQFGAIFPDSASPFILAGRNVCSDTNIGAWTWRWIILWIWCSRTLRDVLGFDMPIVRHAEVVGYLHRLLRFVRNVNVTYESRGHEHFCFKDPIDRIYLLKNADAKWCALELKRWHLRHTPRPRFLEFHSSEMFALPPRKRKDLHTPVPRGWEYESNQSLRVPTPVIFS